MLKLCAEEVGAIYQTSFRNESPGSSECCTYIHHWHKFMHHNTSDAAAAEFTKYLHNIEIQKIWNFAVKMLGS